MSLRILSVTLCVCLVAGLGPGAAGAPRREVANTPERRLAAAEFKRGKLLYAAGDYAGALASFQNGFDAYPLRGFLINIGQCQRRLGHLAEAAAAYQQFLDGKDVSPALRAEVEEALAEVRSAQQAAEPARAVAAASSPGSDDEPPPPRAAEAKPAGAVLTSDATVRKAAPARKSRAWVWALVGVGVVAVGTGVALGVVFGLRGQSPSGGSLGLIDGRAQ